ncbi:outer membrane beta-barrel protein [Catenovulum agarivorans]|uniref:outer membrane beta-barrel protein n=1 Tax=Catenovulum agarivorans TaxID=1172192 RepID=UPI0002FBCE86|nr:outer membrane beta-barrel protein [Catenovulum agarivorans]
MLRHIVKCCVVLIGLAIPALAQQPALLEAQLITGYSDNYQQTANKQSSASVQMKLQLNAAINWRSFDAGVQAKLSEIDYKANNAAKFSRNALAGHLSWQPTNQQTLAINVSRSNAEVEPWLGIRRDSYQMTNNNVLTLAIDETADSTAGLNYAYTTPSEQGLVFSSAFNTLQKDYQATDQLALQNNKKTTSWSNKLGYQWRAGRHLFIQYQQLDSRFTDFSARDNSSRIYAAGLSWQATAITGFNLGIGQETREISQSAAENKTSYWSLQATWAPKSYSVFSLSSTQHQQSSEYQDQLLQLAKTHSAAWRHTWANGLKSSVTLHHQQLQQLASKRDEKRLSGEISLSYQLTNNWQANIAYSYINNIDSSERRNFKQNNLYFSVKYQMGGRA